MLAKYKGYCGRCRTRYAAGTEIRKSVAGKWEHAECPDSLPEKNPGVIYAAGPQRATERRNRKAGHCQDCGEFVAAGKGLLIFCPEDSGCPQHHDYSGYHVSCADEAACGSRRNDRLDQARAACESATARKAALEAVQPIGAAILSCARAQLIEGLSLCSVRPADLVLGDRVSERTGGDTWAYTEATLPDGRRAVVAEWYSYDDSRTHYHVPADVALTSARAYAATNGITQERAREWLAQYSGCEGADIYRAALGE